MSETTEPTFHKLQISPGYDNPVSVVIRDEHDEKVRYKFRYADEDADKTQPGSIVPVAYLKQQEEGTPFNKTHIETAIDGIEKYTKFDVQL